MKNRIKKEQEGLEKIWEIVGFDIPEVPEGFRIMEESCKKNALIAYNDEFGYITFVPTMGEKGKWTNSYEISRNPRTGEIQSKPGFFPWTNISLNEARKSTEEFFNRFPNVKGEVCYDKDWSNILKWFEQSGALTHHQIYKDSKEWGNYWDNSNSTHSMVKTGEKEEFTVNGINNFTGNTRSWVQDNNHEDIAALRGGSFGNHGRYHPASYHNGNYRVGNTGPQTGFRVELWPNKAE